jgi:hypothetical protein
MITRRRNVLLFAGLLFAGLSPLCAEEGAVYRVDVIVFSHVGGETDQRFRAAAADYGDRIDPTANARAAAWIEPSEDEESLTADERIRREALATIDQLRALETGSSPQPAPFRGGPLFPPRWQALPNLSPPMNRAWDRLNLSPAHEPLAWRSWHQPLSRSVPSRWLRITGGWMLGVDWLEPEAADPDFLPDDPPYPFLLPRTLNVLDGQLRVRRSQFFHADLDLVWQLPTEALPTPLLADFYHPAGLSVHSLAQSRSIRPDRIEYFDSSGLGVLIRIEEFAPASGASARTAPAS